MKVLLSIKPEFVNRIITGEKQFEYRKRVFKEDVDTVVVYSTKPVGKIIGEFTIDEIISDSPEKLWDKTKNYSGISKDSFMEYFTNKEKAFAFKIKDFIKYDEPINPKMLIENFVPPQSYMYLDDKVLNFS